MKKRRKDRKKEEERRSKSTASFQLTTRKMPTSPALCSVMIRPTTKRKMSPPATPQSRLGTHQEEDPTFSLAETT
jgi:hypothetical protein